MRLLAWFLGITILILAAWVLWGEGLEARFTLQGTVAYLEGTGSYAWLVAWALLISDVILPVPGTVVMSALGWMYGPLLGGLLSVIGSVLSGLTAYGVCRLAGDRGARWLLGEKDQLRGRKWFEKGGVWLVCVSRSLPILPEVVACSAGLLRMPFRRFLLALICGSLPMGFVFAWVGSAGKEEPLLAMLLSLLLPAVLWACARLILRRLEKEEE